ncbi:uncharacterized protein LOC100118446 isoform X9 [Nasonia vitripennis]|uniref:Cyclic nucleotide-binding domain-containing protein n=1 Tax=Nasonia vitripennis TaxID=7425 RepID=A0A7M7Q6N9_NASVI|nr:uncharacterized protein LOC100118446 isoform X9 [Nasonia vitripennis]
MKLSVSAYRAQASAHKKILSNYQHQLSYGATNQATSARTPSDPAAVLPGLKVSEASFSLSCVFSQLFPKVDRAENVEAQGGGLAPPSSGYHCSAASGSRMGPGPDSGSSAPSSVPHSLATSRDEEDDDDEESSGRRSNGHGGSSFRQQQAAEADRRRDLHVGQRRKIAEIPQKCLPNQPRELRQFLSVIDSSSANVFHCRGSSVAVGGSFQRGASLLSKSFSGSGLGAGSSGGSLGFPASTTSNSLDSACADSSEIPAAARRPRSTRGSQKWSNVRAVMALYSSLRKIKRTKSNQRWMKLRTTVQLSSAISTIQKKPPLKREDSFLKRFSTRQIPESQETIDTGEGEGDQSDDKNSSRRRRRPRRPQKPPKTVVNPDENFYYYWLMLLSACVLYNLWTLIVRQSMPELQEMAPALWLSCDGFTDLVFFLDVGVQFRTGYLEQGLMVYNSKKLAGHYFKSKSFILDLLALLPLDLLQVNLGSNPMLRFPRFLKVYRVYNYYYMVESRTVYPNLWRVLNLIHILLILAHWFGCFYYLLSEAEGFHGDWVYPYRPGEYATLTRKYLGSLYWSTLTLTTIGDLPTPETNAEAVAGGNPRSLARRGRLSRLLQFKHNGGYVFTIVSYLIGVFIFATIVGQVGNVITNRNANRLEFERLLDGAKTYMRHHKVPGGMKRRVLRWYDYSWSRGRIQGGGDINTALGLLPDKLKTELALHVNLSVLKKVTIFQECQPEFLHDLVLKMKAYIFTPGDSICRKGEVAREMFIIADGILEVISETGRVLTTMKAGDFFGEIGILNLDGLNKRTADVRSVGYSELFSLSREDVLAALKDYPEAQEILQKLGEKRLREAQRVARSFRHPPSPGHDSSDNSTGKRIVDKLKSDVKGLKNVLRKSRRNTRPEESLELQPLTSKAPQLRRQTRIDESQDVCTSASEPPVSPLGAGLPLLARLRLLKEKQEREERRNLMETSNQITEQVQTTVEMQNPSSSSSSANVTVPLLQRLLHMKSKAEPDPVIDREAIVAKEPLLPRSVIPEESEIFISSEQNDVKATCTTTTTMLIRSPTSTSDVESNGASRKPWAMLKDASIKTGGQDSMGRVNHRALPPRTSPARKLQIRHSLVHLRQKKTKMYASVDDLSPEYCGLPFVKKLKILNERQKLAELEKVVRSSSLDCGENAEAEFDGNLTRSHSEACAIEYARKLAKLNKSPPGNEPVQSTALAPLAQAQLPSSSSSSSQQLAHEQQQQQLLGQEAGNDALDQQPLPPPATPASKLTFRPLGSAGAVVASQLFGSKPREDECMGELVSGIRDVIQSRLENIQSRFERHFSSLELEIRKRDEIISQLQARILELEQPGGRLNEEEDSLGDSTEHDASLEDDFVDDNEDHPFMRDSSVDTVLTARPRRRHSSPSSTTDSSAAHNRRSWEEHSEEETLELQDLPRSITPQSLWKDDVVIDLESSDESGDELGRPGRSGLPAALAGSLSDEDDEDEQVVEVLDENGHNNWEVAMLAQELEKRRRSSECSSPGS